MWLPVTWFKPGKISGTDSLFKLLKLLYGYTSICFAHIDVITLTRSRSFLFIIGHDLQIEFFSVVPRSLAMKSLLLIAKVMFLGSDTHFLYD